MFRRESIVRMLQDFTAVLLLAQYSSHRTIKGFYALAWKGDFLHDVLQTLRSLSIVDSRPTCLASSSYLQSNTAKRIVLQCSQIYVVCRKASCKLHLLQPRSQFYNLSNLPIRVVGKGMISRTCMVTDIYRNERSIGDRNSEFTDFYKL